MTSARPARLQVAVVGAGRVGATLGAALARAGHRIVAATGVSDASRERARRLLPGAALLAPDEAIAAAELVILSVPDDVLRPLVAGLAEAGAWREGQLVAHTCGAQGIGVLDPAAARGVIALALHPVMTFAGRPEDLDRLDGASFGVTALDEFRPVAESLVVEMGGEPVWVPEPARALYHAALTMGANHLVTLVNDTLDLLEDVAVADPARLLAPLLSASLDNVLRLRDGALTGPVSRGDVATVARHLSRLSETAPQLVGPYVAMARRSAERARAAGRLRAEDAAAVLTALEAAE